MSDELYVPEPDESRVDPEFLMGLGFALAATATPLAVTGHWNGALVVAPA